MDDNMLVIILRQKTKDMVGCKENIEMQNIIKITTDE